MTMVLMKFIKKKTLQAILVILFDVKFLESTIKIDNWYFKLNFPKAQELILSY